MTKPINPSNSNGDIELRKWVVDVLGLEDAPDGTHEQLLTYNQDGEVIEGTDFHGEVDSLVQLIQTERTRTEVAAINKALTDLAMGAGEYHDDPYEYVVPLRHIQEKMAVFTKMLESGEPIFKENAALSNPEQPKEDSQNE